MTNNEISLVVAKLETMGADIAKTTIENGFVRLNNIAENFAGGDLRVTKTTAGYRVKVYYWAYAASKINRVKVRKWSQNGPMNARLVSIIDIAA